MENRNLIPRLFILCAALPFAVYVVHRSLYADLSVVNLTGEHLPLTTRQKGHIRRLDGALNSSLVPALQQEPFRLLVPSAPDPACHDKVLSAIENVVSYNESRFAQCPITSQVQISVQNNDNDESSTVWLLQSRDNQGSPKAVGGDEYYITWTNENAVPDANNITHATLVARAQDQNDGTYILDFATSPMDPNPSNMTGMGRLTVHFEYTCGVGRIGQPMKDTWNSAGYTHTAYHVDNVPLPPYRTFQPPQSNVHLGSYDAVVFLGDSVMNNFAGFDEQHFGKTNIYKGKSPALALNSETVDKWLDQLEKDHGELLRQAGSDQPTALIVGSSTWDILNNEVNQWMDWSDHKEACRHLIQSVRSQYPNVDFLWKSATALHICNTDIESLALRDHFWGVERVRYMSESRSYDIDQVQKKLMAELQVPVLDVYETTYLAADWSRTPEDSRHYSVALNYMMLNWFYKKE